jgi:hypothetical protein
MIENVVWSECWERAFNSEERCVDICKFGVISLKRRGEQVRQERSCLTNDDDQLCSIHASAHSLLSLFYSIDTPCGSYSTSILHYSSAMTLYNSSRFGAFKLSARDRLKASFQTHLRHPRQSTPTKYWQHEGWVKIKGMNASTFKALMRCDTDEMRWEIWYGKEVRHRGKNKRIVKR